MNKNQLINIIAKFLPKFYELEENLYNILFEKCQEKLFIKINKLDHKMINISIIAI